MTVQNVNDPSDTLRLSWFAWRPVVAATLASGAVTQDDADLMSFNSGAIFPEETARAMAATLRAMVLSETASAMGLDGKGTQDDGTFHRAPEDADQNYAIPRERLSELIAFLERCGDFNFG